MTVHSLIQRSTNPMKYLPMDLPINPSIPIHSHPINPSNDHSNFRWPSTSTAALSQNHSVAPEKKISFTHRSIHLPIHDHPSSIHPIVYLPYLMGPSVQRSTDPSIHRQIYPPVIHQSANQGEEASMIINEQQTTVQSSFPLFVHLPPSLRFERLLPPALELHPISQSVVIHLG